MLQGSGILIGGPTAVGKTDLAYFLAEKIGADLLSVDSRQVYRDLDIGTGKDLPDGSKRRVLHVAGWSGPITVYRIGQIDLWGLDLVELGEEWSAAHFYRMAQQVIPVIMARRKKLIMVGGTHFYLNTVYNPPEHLFIPPNLKLRQQLSALSVYTLQRRLQTLRPRVYDSMHTDDRLNRRRLVRALEVGEHQRKGTELVIPTPLIRQPLVFGLGASLPVIKTRIRKRVLWRSQQEKFEVEVRRIMKAGMGVSPMVRSIYGYQEWGNYLLGKVSKQEALDQWISREYHYAKRQLTWLRKLPDVRWVDTARIGWRSDVELEVRNWYS